MNNRKNIRHDPPFPPTRISVQEFDRTGAFSSSQLTLGNINYCQEKEREQLQKWTTPLTMDRLQPYLLSIHHTLTRNLHKKSLQRQLTPQEESLLQSSRHDKHMQQFISGILAIQTCVQQLTHQHTSTIVSFIKATNLLLINYKFLYMEYVEMRNSVKTSQSLSICDDGKSDGFLKFFDSLKFLGLVVKNCVGNRGVDGRGQGDEQMSTARQYQQRNNDNNNNNNDNNNNNNHPNTSLSQSLQYQLTKLQDLITLQNHLPTSPSPSYSPLSPSSPPHSPSHPSSFSQHLITLHNQQSQIIISQLQKENNFLKYQIYQKENTITEYEESIYNVDLSRYRENEEREDYWAKRVRFSSGGNNNSSVNRGSKLISGIEERVLESIEERVLGSLEEKVLESIQERVLQPIKQKVLQSSAQLLFNQQLSQHLSLLSRKMQQLQQQNLKLKKQLNLYNQSPQYHLHQHPHHQPSPHQSSSLISQQRFQEERQRLDSLIKEIKEMKVTMMGLEEREGEMRRLCEEKERRLKEVEEELGKQISERDGVIRGMEEGLDRAGQEFNRVQQELSKKEKELERAGQELNRTNKQLNRTIEQLNLTIEQLHTKSHQLTSLTHQLTSLQSQTQHLTQQITLMNEEFTKQMDKYNIVFFKISQELSASLEKVEWLEKENRELRERSRRLQEENVRMEAVVVGRRTREVCGNDAGKCYERLVGGSNKVVDQNNVIHGNDNVGYQNPGYSYSPRSRVSVPQPNNQHQSTTNPLSQKQPHPDNQEHPLLTTTHHSPSTPNPKQHPTLTQPPSNKRLSTTPQPRSVTPPKGHHPQRLQQQQLQVSRKKIAIKIEGNRIVNQIVERTKREIGVREGEGERQQLQERNSSNYNAQRRRREIEGKVNGYRSNHNNNYNNLNNHNPLLDSPPSSKTHLLKTNTQTRSPPKRQPLQSPSHSPIKPKPNDNKEKDRY